MGRPSLRAHVRFLRLCPGHIKAVQGVAWRILFLDSWTTAFNVIDDHRISDKSGRLWRHISEAGQLVHRVQRVRRLALRREFLNLRLSPLDVCVRQVKFRFVEAYMQHARSGALYIFVNKIEFRPVQLLGPDSGLGS